MFLFCNIASLTKYFFIWASTQFLLCMAIPKDAERWSSGRSLLDYDLEEAHDRMIFFVVLSVGALIIGLITTYMWKEGYCSIDSSSSADDHAVVHPPPVNFHPIPPNFGYNNTGYVPTPSYGPSAPVVQNQMVVDDRPPDYATVALSDLTRQQSHFPEVVKKKGETPPPQFGDHAPFQ